MAGHGRGAAAGVWVAVGLCTSQGQGESVCATWRGRALCGYKGLLFLDLDLDAGGVYSHLGFERPSEERRTEMAESVPQVS